MDKVAFLFSGQGAQYPGMGKSLCGTSGAAAEIFRLADRIRPGTSRQCFSGSRKALSVTANTQPCVYSVDLAAAEALREAGAVPSAAAGFSLGEIAALSFAGVFSPEDGFSLVCSRGRLMDDAAGERPGFMAAVLKLSDKMVEEICGRFRHVYPVNYNCPGQIAVAGGREEREEFLKAASDAGGRAVPLAVSGAFHSPFMDPAAEKLRAELRTVPVSAPRFPVYSDYLAEPYGGRPEEIRETAALQVNHPVYWKRILQKMNREGIHTFIETGPGKVLSGLVRRTLPGARVFHVEDEKTLRETAAALGLEESE